MLRVVAMACARVVLPKCGSLSTGGVMMESWCVSVQLLWCYFYRSIVVFSAVFILLFLTPRRFEKSKYNCFHISLLLYFMVCIMWSPGTEYDYTT